MLIIEFICPKVRTLCLYDDIICERRSRLGCCPSRWWRIQTWESEKRGAGERIEALGTLSTWVSPQGVLLYGCCDTAHKQPLWGIKCKDLAVRRGDRVLSSAESLLCFKIGVSLDHHVLATWCLSPTRGD